MPVVLSPNPLFEKPSLYTTPGMASASTVHAGSNVVPVKLALDDLPLRPPEKQFVMSPRIGVITSYRSQVHLIHRKLREARLLQNVHVGTINTVQSLQFEVVIFDTVEAPCILRL